MKTKLIGIEELQEGKMKEVDVANRQILIAKVKDKYYATQGQCPHMGGRLALGTLSNTLVTCPVHGSQFDLVDGKVIRWTNFPGWMSSFIKIMKPAKPLETFKIYTEGDNIFIDV